MTVIAATPNADGSVSLSTTTNVTVYSSRSISWDTVTLPSGATFPGGVIFADTVLEERHDDDSVITDNPVENGSVVNDHAYDLPQELELTYVWDAVKQAKGQPGFLETMYAQVLSVKQAKVLVNVVTGKRSYQGMLIKGISEVTDKDTENVLMLRLSLKQIIQALTQTVTIPQNSVQANAAQTGRTTNTGNQSVQPAPNINTSNSGS